MGGRGCCKDGGGGVRCVSNDGFGVVRPVLLLLLLLILLGGSKSYDDGPLSLLFREGVEEGGCGRGPFNEATETQREIWNSFS